METIQQRYQQQVAMNGSSGNAVDSQGNTVLTFPNNLRGIVKYANISNMTNNTLYIYGANDNPLTAPVIHTIGQYMRLSIPLFQNTAEGLRTTFVSGDSSTLAKYFQIEFTDVSNGWNHSMTPSFPTNTTASNVNVTGPLVGGAVSVNLANQNPVNDYSTPFTSSQTNAATSIVVGSSGGQSVYVTYANYRVTGGAIGASDVSITIKDGATTVYQSAIPRTSINGTNAQIVFCNPIKISANSNMTFSIGASGTAVTTILSNVGVFIK